MSNGVWIIAEHREGKLKKISFELLTVGRQLASKIGQPLAAILLGYEVDHVVVASYLPEQIVTNKDIVKMGFKGLPIILERGLGAKERYGIELSH